MSEQLELPGGGGETSGSGSRDDLPLIYVVSSLTGLDRQGHLLVDLSCKIIKMAIIEGSTQPGSTSPTISVHTPITATSPQKGDDLPPEEIYEYNFSRVADADGLVILGYRGGGYGGGQEISWGVALRIPMLFLSYEGEGVSRQIRGTPADITFQVSKDADDLEFIVRNFIKQRRGQFQRHAAARGDRAITFASAHATLASRWEAVDDNSRKGIAATSGMHLRRAQALVTDINVLASASAEEITALSGALGITTHDLFLPQRLPVLMPKEMSALRQTAKEYELTGEDVIELQIRAQLELSKGGTRRLSFSSVQNWIDFRDSTK